MAPKGLEPSQATESATVDDQAASYRETFSSPRHHADATDLHTPGGTPPALRQRAGATASSSSIDSTTALQAGKLRVLAEWQTDPAPPDACVFSNSADGLEPMALDRLSEVRRRLADREGGVDARLHHVRRLQANVLLNAGQSITTVAARLGHRDTATMLRVYAHLMPGAEERAADIVGDMLS